MKVVTYRHAFLRLHADLCEVHAASDHPLTCALFGVIGSVERGEHEGECAVCASAQAAEQDAQDFADRLLAKLDPAMLDFHEAGYRTAQEAAEAIVGDSGPAAVRLRVAELVAEALEAGGAS